MVVMIRSSFLDVSDLVVEASKENMKIWRKKTNNNNNRELVFVKSNMGHFVNTPIESPTLDQTKELLYAFTDEVQRQVKHNGLCTMPRYDSKWIN